MEMSERSLLNTDLEGGKSYSENVPWRRQSLKGPLKMASVGKEECKKATTT